MINYDRLAAIFPYNTLPKVPVLRCPACHVPRNGQVPVPALDRCGFAIATIRCPECSLLYLHEHLTRDGYVRLYDGAYRSLVAALRDPAYDPSTAPPPEQCDLRDSYLAMIGPRLRAQAPRTLLDAGGGSGEMTARLAVLCEAPPAVTVLDPAPDVHMPGMTFVQGYLEDPIVGTFDCALCLETLDHVTDPIAALRHLRDAVPRGTLFVDVIDTDLHTRNKLRRLLKVDHPLNWTRKALTCALQRSGWTIRRSGFLRQRLVTRSRVAGLLRHVPDRVLMECE